VNKTQLEREGFTLIEISISIALLLLIALLGLQLFSFNRQALARIEMENIYALMLYLQRKALLTNKVEKLSFDSINHSYYGNNTHFKLHKNVYFGRKRPIGSFGKSSEMLEQEQTDKAITFKDTSIYFYPDGIISPGAIYIKDNNTISAYALTSGIAKASYIRKYLYDKGQWKLLC
jgi:prepilin-type N-terminal cleavage/methylation domain-containing protein